MNQKNSILSEHFERLKELIPEVYTSQPAVEGEIDKELLSLLRKSLNVIEAIYLQNGHKLNLRSTEEYGEIIQQLNNLGYTYEGNEELMQKAANQLLIDGKKPMQKAKGGRKSNEQRKAM